MAVLSYRHSCSFCKYPTATAPFLLLRMRCEARLAQPNSQSVQPNASLRLTRLAALLPQAQQLRHALAQALVVTLKPIIARHCLLLPVRQLRNLCTASTCTNGMASRCTSMYVPAHYTNLKWHTCCRAACNNIGSSRLHSRTVLLMRQRPLLRACCAHGGSALTSGNTYCARILAVWTPLVPLVATTVLATVLLAILMCECKTAPSC
jgi:hypothetical protein